MTAGFEGPSSSVTALRCPKCSLPFEIAPASMPAWVNCQACRSTLSVALLPALTNPPAPISTASGERADEGEAVCFFHPEKRADGSCARCGRFICALCDMPFGGRHFCPKCLDSSKMAELVPTRFVGGYVSMLLGVLPIVLFPISLSCFYILPFTAGTAIGFGWWSWKKPGSLVRGPRHGMAIAGIVGGLLQFLATGGMIALIVYGIRNN